MIIANQQNINTKKHYSISTDVSNIGNILKKKSIFQYGKEI